MLAGSNGTRYAELHTGTHLFVAPAASRRAACSALPAPPAVA